jgi:hypothetical protein
LNAVSDRRGQGVRTGKNHLHEEASGRSLDGMRPMRNTHGRGSGDELGELAAGRS